MGAIPGKLIKSEDGVTVRLPAEFGLEPGASFTIQRNGGTVTLRLIETPKDIQRDLAAMAAEIEAIWAEAGGAPPPEVRDPDIFPNRPGLY